MTGLRRFPWLSGLIAAITIAFWLIYAVIDDAITVIGNTVDTTDVASYRSLVLWTSSTA